MAKKKKKSLTGKALAQRRHAERRFLQRTNVELTPQLHDQLTAKIQENASSAKFVEKQSNRITVWDVTHKVGKKEITFRIVYDRMRRNITTILNNADRGELFLFHPERRRDV